MKMRFWAILFTLFHVFTLQGRDIHFQTLGVDHGLSQSSAISIWQDKTKRMWFGNDALNCYDGESVKVYRISEYFSEVEDSNIHGICGNDSTLFFLAENQLVCFDLIKETFRLPGINTNAIYCSNNKFYYVAENSFYQYDYGKNEKEVILNLPQDISTVTSILQASEDIYWISTAKGIYIIDSKQKIITGHLLSNKVITNLFKDSQNQIWILSGYRNLYLSDLEGKTCPVSISNNKEYGLSNYDIYCIEEDSKGSIWLGTLSGLFQVSKTYTDSEKITIVNHVLAESTIFALFFDYQETLWIGSYYGDVRYFNPETDNYTYYSTDESHPERLHGAVIGMMAEDNNGNLYIATEGSGINILGPQGDKIGHLKVGNGLSQNKIRALWCDNKKNRLYISSYMNGMSYLNLETKKIHPINNGDIATPSQCIIEEIIPYKNFLILLTQNGLFKLDKETLKISYLFDDPQLRETCSGIIRTIHIDDRDILWVSSFKQGLFTIDLKTRSILRFYGDGLMKNSQIPSAVVSICGNNKKGLFFGTLKSGLLSYIAEQDTFLIFTEEERDILSNICYNVTFSWFDNLVITTNKGISILNISNKRSINSANHIRLNPTFPLSALSIDCGLYASKAKDKIYVGGLYGLLVFSERDLVIGNNNYSIYFSSLWINNKPITPSSPLLEKSLSLVDKIVLKHNQNTLNLTFASSNYLSSRPYKHEYKLEGLDNFWTETDHKSVIYNSLRPGKYKLIVREVSNIEKKAELTIIIKSPIWLSFPAILSYIIIIGALCWWVLRFYRVKNYLKTSLELERREVARIEELNQNKMDFFINISNEFRSPLTIILSQLERLSHELSQTGKNKVEKIKRQTSRMQDIISELVDFRKMEQNKLPLKVKEYNLTDFLQEIYATYIDYASEKQVTYRFNHIGEPLLVWVDIKQIQKVFYNLLAFVFKGTTKKNSITIFLQRKNKWAEIQIVHKGEILHNEAVEYLTDVLNNESNHSPDLTLLPEGGISLAFSKGLLQLHKGEITVEKEENKRTFIIRLQLGNSHFSEKELSNNNTEILEPLHAIESDIVEYELNEEIDSPTTEKKELRMLLIENDDEIRALLKESFSIIYDVVEVQDGEAGYEYAIKESPDIILSEISIPGYSGIEMCQRLKSNINTLQIPIILITSQPSEKQHIESIRSGADDYIIKPFSIEVLFLRCNYLVKNRKKIVSSLSNQLENDTLEITTNSHDQKFLSTANQILEENWSNSDFDTTLWSKLLGIGRTRLFSQIKAITGMTPNDYILHMKMNKSITLLTEKRNLTIAEVAYQLGFTNPAYFSKCFKKQFGITPAEYRKKE